MYPIPVSPVSLARRELIGLITARRFTRTLAGWGVAKPMAFASYETALGKREPSFGVIFALREHVSPELWFYDEGEKPPRPVKVRFQYRSAAGEGGESNKILIREKVLRDETAALKKLGKIMEKRELPAFSREHGVKYLDMWGICSKRKKAGGYGYHQRPPYRVVKALREVIHPALWYVFPDELIRSPSGYSFI
jgi:hypothetical protein